MLYLAPHSFFFTHGVMQSKLMSVKQTECNALINEVTLCWHCID